MCDPGTVFRITFGEDGDLSKLDRPRGATERADNVVDEVGSLLFVHDFSEEVASLLEVIDLLDDRAVSAWGACDLWVDVLGPWVDGVWFGGVGFIVGVASLVAIDVHGTISLVVAESGSVRAVDRDLVVVGAESVTMGVWVGEESSLEHFVEGGLHAGYHVRGGEGDLFDFGEEVLWITIEDDTADGDEWVVAVWPNFGHVINVDSVFLGVFNGHDLDLEIPRGVVAFFDSLKEVTSGVFGVLCLHGISLISGVVFDSLISFEVHFDVEAFTGLVVPPEGVGGVPVHFSITIGSATV